MTIPTGTASSSGTDGARGRSRKVRYRRPQRCGRQLDLRRYRGGLSVSTDGGATFTTYTSANGLGVNLVRSVYVDGSTVYAGMLGGLVITTTTASDSTGGDGGYGADGGPWAVPGAAGGVGGSATGVSPIGGDNNHDRAVDGGPLGNHGAGVGNSDGTGGIASAIGSGTPTNGATGADT